MINDPIVDELRHFRKLHTEKYDHDLKRIASALREKERASKRPLLNPEPKRVVKQHEMVGNEKMLPTLPGYGEEICIMLKNMMQKSYA